MTQTELNIQVVNGQCCAANVASKLVQYIMTGDIASECMKFKFFALMNVINALVDYDITSSCLSTDEVCTLVTRMNHICSECC